VDMTAIEQAAGRHGSPAVRPATPDASEEEALRAIGHPGRRAMLRLAWDAERTSSELADAAGLSRSAASQHLKILREAGLVHVRVDANRRLYRVDLERLGRLRAFLDEFWGDRLDSLRSTAETLSRRRRDQDQRGTA
jgi:DNA-binding transcriptional ArsR family regulator